MSSKVVHEPSSYSMFEDLWSHSPSAQRLPQGDKYLDNINVGNLAGTLWYIHNEARDEFSVWKGT